MSDQYTRVDYRHGELVRHARDAKFKIVPVDALVVEAPQPTWLNRGHAEGYLASAMGFVSTRPVFDADLLDRAREHAVGVITAAEYLSAHPHVDEAQVDPLAEAISDAYGFGDDHAAPYHVARHLLAQGWTKPAVES